MIDRITNAQFTSESPAFAKPMLPAVVGLKRYSTIVIDPPWEVKNNLKDVRYYRSGSQRMPYEQMTDRDIMKLPIENLADENCDLFLWSITSKIPVCFELLKWWGFKYIDFFAWDKEIGVPVNGIYRSVEWVIYGYKGKMGINKSGKFINSMIREKRTTHSKKPNAFYDMIRNNTKENRIDMFARELKEGFDVFGNEVENSINLKMSDSHAAQRSQALRWPPKKNLIINRDFSGGYCKTAVSRWPFSQHK